MTVFPDAQIGYGMNNKRGCVLGDLESKPPPSSAEVKERVELYLYSPLWAFVACSRVNFAFTFT